MRGGLGGSSSITGPEFESLCGAGTWLDVLFGLDELLPLEGDLAGVDLGLDALWKDVGLPLFVVFCGGTGCSGRGRTRTGPVGNMPCSQGFGGGAGGNRGQIGLVGSWDDCEVVVDW